MIGRYALILAIDTSGHTASVALVKDNTPLGEVCLAVAQRHSQVLMPAVDALFALTSTQRTEVTAVAYTGGPGSFTGLRIGAAAAMGLAHALAVPAIPVPTLRALAYNISGGIVMPMLDARRGQVYTAIYQGDTEIHEPTAVTIMEAISLLAHRETVTFLGYGATAYASEIRRLYPAAVFAPFNNNTPRATAIAILAQQLDITNSPINYIRQPQAVRDEK
jgi:tRNA threonylcarbamoyladenosine biosynthesis protein TsaB